MLVMTKAKKASNGSSEKDAEAHYREKFAAFNKSLIDLWDNEYDEIWNNY